MTLLAKIVITLFFFNGILSIIIQVAFDKGDSYTSPLFENKIAKFMFYLTSTTSLLCIFIFIIGCVVWALIKLWAI